MGRGKKAPVIMTCDSNRSCTQCHLRYSSITMSRTRDGVMSVSGRIPILWRSRLYRAVLLLWLMRARHDLVDAQQHRRRLNRRLDRLRLDGDWLPHTDVFHVREHTLLAIDAPRRV